jgi:hypothetical protein
MIVSASGGEGLRSGARFSSAQNAEWFALSALRMIVLLVLITAVERTSAQNFLAPQSFLAGSGPFALVSSDFNRDGRPDFAVVAAWNNKLAILLANSDGTWTRTAEIPAPAGVEFLVTGDFNGDSKVDLAVSAWSDQSFSVLLGDGAGGFAAPLTYGLGANAGGIAAGDFDRDGRLDLAVVLANVEVQIRRGNGDGTFVLGNSYPLPSYPFNVAVADLDLDGTLDLIVCRLNGPLAVLHGRGDGSFGAPTSVTVGTNSVTAVIADLNRDRRPDVVVVNNFSKDVTVLLASGSDFTTTSYPVGNDPMFATVGDFDRNGAPDIAVGNRGGNGVSLLYGRGDGSFLAAPALAVNNPQGVLAGDFDRDGRADLAVLGLFTSDVKLFSNAIPANSPRSGVRFTSLRYGPATLDKAVPADFNRDGYDDILVATNSIVRPLFLLLGSATQQLTLVEVPLPPQMRTVSPVVGDLNGDGKPDIALSGLYQNQGTVLLGRGDGTFDSPVSFDQGSFSGGGTPSIGHLNHDSKPDLFFLQRGDNQVSVVMADGAGGFLPPVRYAVGSEPTFMVNADFNRDGNLDLVTVNQGTPSISVLLGVGDGTFSPAVNTACPKAFGVTTGDFNRDGKLDLVLALTGTGSAGVMLGNGDGSFTAPVSYAAGTLPRSIGALDANGDGILDLTVAGELTSLVSVLLGKPDGTFDSLVQFSATGSGWNAQVVGDWNADGFIDTLIFNAADSTFTLLLNSATSAVTLDPPVTNSVYKQPVNLKAHASGTGSVTFTRNGIALGTVQEPSVADYLLASDALVTGSNSVTAAYSGNSSYWPSLTPIPVTFQVNPAATNTTLSVGTTPVFYPAESALSAQVTAVAPGGGTPAGTIRFISDGFSLGDPIDIGPTGAGMNRAFTPGVHAITAQYSGSGDHLTSNVTVQLDVRIATTVSVTATPPAPQFGTSIQLSVAVTPAFSIQGGARGTVKIFENSTLLRQVAINGTASVATSVSGLSAGAHDLIAEFAASVPFAGSQSSPVHVVIAPADTMTVLTTSSGTVDSGEPVMFTAKVTSGGGLPTTGNVEFRSGSTVIGTVGLDGTGSAKLSTTALPSGSSLVTASYLGVLNFAPSSSAAITQVVLAPGAEISATSLAFGTVVASRISPAQTVQLTNTGTGTLRIATITVTGEFSQANDCMAGVAAGGSCHISVTFRPPGGAPNGLVPLSGALTITHNATGSPFQVALSGASFDMQLALSRPARPRRDSTASSSMSAEVMVSAPGMAGTVKLECIAPAGVQCRVPATVTLRDGIARGTLQAELHALRPQRLVSIHSLHGMTVILRATIAGATQSIPIGLEP